MPCFQSDGGAKRLSEDGRQIQTSRHQTSEIRGRDGWVGLEGRGGFRVGFGWV